ncbi:hypothetical protein TVAG_011860 [Trichomonas vaginalis G3]|uniref:KilA-N domain-containing protein n=2 Tax=Trichomonas vaginalis (strain ATCC PRA-98 / G3) TaxID=412133 RepID=A2GF56_TRIV3|nr:hypothetical protein TVAGG3_0160750 [Trichomonas vaginalis G3]EAX84210.1 hypothetical protein TVAG_011860 [Trichomonas vaginalis G3]KAI5547853.1 hypothetical protein TVAGG3_0160750 [Trichomonas vaginalis G3]|eukprot:XP_001297140.1 hypothetical protein [Trichomonas vaginalis G3]
MAKHSQKALITVLKSYVETRMVTLMQQICVSSLGKTLESCWKISPGKSIIRHFVKNIATAGIQTVVFLYKIHAGIPDEIKQVRGTYVDPRLINYIAMWASPKYCIAVGKIMDSIDKKVHEKLDEEELEDTVENAKPLFEQEVRKMCEKQLEHEREIYYGYRDSPYELDQWEQEDLKREFREYELAKIALEAAEKKLKAWGSFCTKIL